MRVFGRQLGVHNGPRDYRARHAQDVTTVTVATSFVDTLRPRLMHGQCKTPNAPVERSGHHSRTVLPSKVLSKASCLWRTSRGVRGVAPYCKEQSTLWNVLSRVPGGVRTDGIFWHHPLQRARLSPFNLMSRVRTVGFE